ncbi:MAG: SufD family Fe-S cluster assembly protein [Patescibacteria group bacterium]
MKQKIVKATDQKIVVPDGEELLILDYISNDRLKSNLQINIGRQCLIKYILIIDNPVSDLNQLTRAIYIGDNSRLYSRQAYFGAGDIQAQINNYLGHASFLDSQAFLYQIAKQDSQIEDNYIFRAPNSQGKFLVTEILDDQAKAAYYSDIIIKPEAQGTDSRIDMKLYLLSDQASGQFLPGLKIAANEVKAGHGASTFNLSDADLFYLQARGLTISQIKKLIINSLTERFIACIDDQKVAKIISVLIKKRRTGLVKTKQ